MTKLTRDDIVRLARLARIEVNENEIEAYVAEISEIIQYVELLDSVDVSGLEPTNQVSGVVNVSRNDEIIDYGYEPSDLMKNVPEVQNSQIKVNRMVG